MNCNYFGACGACKVHDLGYEGQLKQKTDINQERFSSMYAKPLEVFASEDEHYRSRSEFKIWHVEESIHYAMNALEHKGVVLVEACPQVNQHIYALMPKLIKALKEQDIDFKLFGADFLSARDGSIVLSLLYHRKLDILWQERATLIAKDLGISIIGRSRGQKVVIGNDYVIEEVHLPTRVYKFKYIENSFTQPNLKVNEKMVAWALRGIEEKKSDLLELYCGAGNFTIPFATKFNKVLATEISKSSIHAAQTNMQLNDIENIEFVRMSVEEFVGALDGVREYNRMKHINISDYNIQTIFVDPPRSGMDEASCRFTARYENIIYISCNPETLHRDMEILTQTHDVLEMALFDQFPYTHHAEMGVKLKKRVL